MAPFAFSLPRSLLCWLSVSLTLAVLILPSTTASGKPGDTPKSVQVRANAPPSMPVRRAVEPWSARFAAITGDIHRGKPLVAFVIVPLCNNDQINCGSTVAGLPGNLKTNLYWGAVFGLRRFFDRKNSGWTRLDLTQGADQGFFSRSGKPLNDVPEGVLLERAVYRRKIDESRWSGAGAAGGEQIVVLQAVHGAEIDRAVSLFWSLSTEGGRVRFHDGERMRDERIHVAGYAGHNRLMDGVKLPAIAAAGPSANAIPSFVMACESDAYFSDSLRKAGSDPLVMTRSLMAPEGYVIDGIARALGDNAALPKVRDHAIKAYAKWQRLSDGVASGIFARTR